MTMENYLSTILPNGMPYLIINGHSFQWINNKWKPTKPIYSSTAPKSCTDSEAKA